MPEDIPASLTDDAAFHLAIVRYLEGDISPRELVELNEQLRTSPGRREVFVQMCLTRAGLIEEISSKAEHNRQSTSPVELLADELAPLHDLSETIVSPALQALPDEIEEQPEFTPAPFVVKPPVKGKLPRWPFAASILIILTAGVVLFFKGRANPSSADSQGNPSPAVAVNPATVNPAAANPTTAPAIAPPIAQKDIASQTQLPKVVVVERDLGTLACALDAEWDPADSALVASSRLPPGPHTLVRGVADIKFTNGTDLVIQGPARFQADSDSHIRLSQGRLCATVPHTGAELTVSTPDMNAVDLGTEFGVNVRPDVQTHLEVFQGHVRGEVTSPSGAVTAKLLSDNQAVVAANGSGKLEDAAPTPLAFVRPAEIDALAKANDTPFKRWLSFSLTLRQDPDLVAYYPFDNQAENPTELINRAAATRNQNNGVFGNGPVKSESPQWTTGRWPGKGALRFGDNGATAVTFNDDHIIPARAITLGIWLKRTEAARAVHLFNGTVGTETHFNLNLMGTLGKSVPRLEPNTIYFTWAQKDVASLPALPRDDRWYFLTITSDPHTQTQFYLDGKLICSVPSNGGTITTLDSLVLGAPVHGNTDADYHDIFHGAIDELMIFQRVLSTDEIQRIFDAGGHY